MVQKKIFITGGSGYIGKAFLRDVGSKFAIKIFGRTRIEGNFEFLPGDIRNAGDVFRASQEVNVIVHLAALTSDRKSANDQEIFETNVVGTLNILESAVKNKVGKVIYVSSVCAVGFGGGFSRIKETDPCHPSDGMYGYSKYLSERLCEFYASKYRLRIICLRLATVIPQHKLILPSSLLSPPYWLTYVHIEDVIQSLNLAIENDRIPFGMFHIAGDSPHSQFDISCAKSILRYRPEHNFEEIIGSRWFYSCEKIRVFLSQIAKRIIEKRIRN